MTSPLFNNLPVDYLMPDEWDDARRFVAEQQGRIAEAVNSMTRGEYETIEMLNGESFLSLVAPQKRYVYRKVIDTGALPNSSTKNVPHGTSIHTLIRCYGAAKSASGFIPLPFVGVSSGSIELRADATNVIITTADDKTAFTSSFVVLEYTKN